MIELGHVVYYVRDLNDSVKFYSDALSLEVVGKIFNGCAALLTGGRTHHELLLIQVSDATGPLSGKRIGLYHVGWKVGNSLQDLRRTRVRISELGYEIQGMSDHTVSQSIYLNDPDGNEVELFVDNPSYDWKHDSSWIQAPVKALQL
ncbi:MAG: VOC family protein [Gammaproteobacteria bacterium]|nr:MAG: VOC family protein [Gammaproteobacteria bacterium]